MYPNVWQQVWTSTHYKIALNLLSNFWQSTPNFKAGILNAEVLN